MAVRRGPLSGDRQLGCQHLLASGGLFLGLGVLVELVGLLLVKDLRQARHVEELEVLQQHSKLSSHLSHTQVFACLHIPMSHCEAPTMSLECINGEANLQLRHLRQAQARGARPGAGLHCLAKVLVLRVIHHTLALAFGRVNPVGTCAATPRMSVS